MQLRLQIQLQLLNCKVKGLKSKAVSPPLRGGDLLSCLAKKVGKEGDPDGAKDSSSSGKKSG
ncbi:hypothetical protein RA280_30575, partial [Cupriavidus sp. CV2]|uniref:hypothetical protein n=1 Tax=Cupriavidus ulmosensis TaxID=3065913 RepID=UPI00296AB6C6